MKRLNEFYQLNWLKINKKQMNAQMELQRLQNEIEEEVKKYNAIEKKAQQYVQARNSLYEQESENTLVLQ